MTTHTNRDKIGIKMVNTKMGKKLGAAFIIYGILNLLGGIVFLFMIPIVGLARIVWSIIFIAIGSSINEETAAVCDECNEIVKYTRIKCACGIWICAKCVLLIKHTHWDILTEYHKQQEE